MYVCVYVPVTIGRLNNSNRLFQISFLLLHANKVRWDLLQNILYAYMHSLNSEMYIAFM